MVASWLSKCCQSLCCYIVSLVPLAPVREKFTLSKRLILHYVLFLNNFGETCQWLLNMFRTSSSIRRSLPDSTTVPHYLIFPSSMISDFLKTYPASTFFLTSYFCATWTVCLKITYCSFLTKHRWPWLTLLLSWSLQVFNGFDSSILRVLPSLTFKTYFYLSDFPDALSSILNSTPTPFLSSLAFVIIRVFCLLMHRENFWCVCAPSPLPPCNAARTGWPPAQNAWGLISWAWLELLDGLIRVLTIPLNIQSRMIFSEFP